MPDKTKVKESPADYEVPSILNPAERSEAIAAIFGSETRHGLSIFNAHELNALTFWKTGNRYVLHCLVRNKKVAAKPEEVVRQLTIKRLQAMSYELPRIKVEDPITMGSSVHPKPADIVVYREPQKLIKYVIIECKKPGRREGRDQLESYMNATGVPFGLWTNGNEEVAVWREEPNLYEPIDRLPHDGETIDDVKKPLLKRNLEPLVNLRELVEELEERVLANAGVSAFDEIFPLIFAKLYDEATKGEDEAVAFRRGSETPEELHRRIIGLYQRAVRHPGWNEIFDERDRISLSPQALVPCVAELQKYRFFSSDLDVLDAAFEHLVNPEQKGDKGQYFTPRHVVRMCVKMLNPKENEKCLDPACGPCGFMIHTLKHVTESEQFRNRWKGEWKVKRTEYAQNFLYAIDFDNKLAKVAKVMMLIMGDGKTNVFRVNSLDPREWNENGRQKEAARRIKDGDFDIIMTNPPFAGEIDQAEVLGNYDLAYKGDATRHKRATKIDRHILFIERCLKFLRPDGRMAIVLPQGILNNANAEFIRDYVLQHARLLGVVGLHVNMFKPFTGTKTSVLFLQKWESDEQRRAAGDYRIFFGTSQKPGKDNSGDYIYVDKDGRRVRNLKGKRVGVDIFLEHDLDYVAGAFTTFAKEESLDLFV